MADFFRKIIRNQLVSAIVSIIFGIVLIAYRGNAVATIIRILGYLLFVGAVVYIIAYFVGKDGIRNPSQLASGILCALFGIICVATPGWLVSLFPVVLGIVLIISSIFNLSVLLSSPFHTGIGGLSLVLSILTLIFGILAIVDPWGTANILILFIGLTYLINGIGDLVAISLIGK